MKKSVSAQGVGSHWERFAPWFLTVASLTTLIGIAVFLVSNIVWFQDSVSTVQQDAFVFRIHIYHMHLAMVKRSVGLFSGFATLFLGIGVSFYHLRSTSQYRIGGQVGAQTTFAIEAVSASPGILSIIVGAALLFATISSKDSFSPYGGEYSIVPPNMEPLQELELPEVEPPQELELPEVEQYQGENQ